VTRIVRSRVATADRLRGMARQLPIVGKLVRVPSAVAASAAGAIVVWRSSLMGDVAELVLAASLAVGVASALADRAAVTLASSPTSRPWRVAARLSVVLPVALACWSLARALTGWLVDGTGSLVDLTRWAPGRDAVLVVATYALVALAAEAATGSPSDAPGLRGSITVLLGTATALFLPPGLALVPVEAHRGRWLVIAVLSALVLVRALADPARRRSRLHGRAARPGSAARSASASAARTAVDGNPRP
jgi:hypothetical protein